MSFVAAEEVAFPGTSEGDERVGVTKEFRVAIKVDGDKAGIGGTLGGGDCDGFVPALREGLGLVLGAGENGVTLGGRLDEGAMARGVVESWDHEERGDVLGDSTGPEAVEVDVGPEVVDLGGDAMVGGGSVSRVVLALEGVAEDNDELERGVGQNREI